MLLLLWVCMTAVGGYAQEGFGLWSTAEVTKKITKGLNVSLDGDFRSADNLRQVDRWDVGLGVSYRLCPYLKVGAGYTYLYNYNPSKVKYKTDEVTFADNGYYSMERKYYSPYWVSRHRWNVDVAGNYTFGRFEVSLRERYQHTYECKAETKRQVSYLYYSGAYDSNQGGYPYVGSSEGTVDNETSSKTYDAESKNVLRSRLSVEYNIRRCPVDPYVDFETWNSLDNGGSVKKTRYSVGIVYKLNKQSEFDLGYNIQHYANSDEKNLYAVSVGYSYKF
jgi:hypothetical protein